MVKKLNIEKIKSIFINHKYKNNSQEEFQKCKNDEELTKFLLEKTKEFMMYPSFENKDGKPVCSNLDEFEVYVFQKAIISFLRGMVWNPAGLFSESSAFTYQKYEILGAYTSSLHLVNAFLCLHNKVTISKIVTTPKITHEKWQDDKEVVHMKRNDIFGSANLLAEINENEDWNFNIVQKKHKDKFEMFGEILIEYAKEDISSIPNEIIQFFSYLDYLSNLKKKMGTQYKPKQLDANNFEKIVKNNIHLIPTLRHRVIYENRFTEDYLSVTRNKYGPESILLFRRLRNMYYSFNISLQKWVYSLILDYFNQLESIYVKNNVIDLSKIDLDNAYFFFNWMTNTCSLSGISEIELMETININFEMKQFALKLFSLESLFLQQLRKFINRKEKK